MPRYVAQAPTPAQPISPAMLKALREIDATGNTGARYTTRMALYNRSMIVFKGGSDTYPELTKLGRKIVAFHKEGWL